jgi:hypothetical protein
MKPGLAAALLVALLTAATAGCSPAAGTDGAPNDTDTSAETEVETPVETVDGCDGRVAEYYDTSNYAAVMEFQEESVENATAALGYQTQQAPFCVIHGVGKDGSPANQWDLWYEGESGAAPQEFLDSLVAAGFEGDDCLLDAAPGHCSFWLKDATGATNFDAYWGLTGPSFDDTIYVAATRQQF